MAEIVTLIFAHFKESNLLSETLNLELSNCKHNLNDERNDSPAIDTSESMTSDWHLVLRILAPWSILMQAYSIQINFVVLA